MNAALSAVPSSGTWQPISSPQLLPAVHRVITTPTGKLQMREADQKHVAIARLGDGSYACFAVDSSNEAVTVILSRAKQSKLAVQHRYTVTPEILEAIYDREVPTSNQAGDAVIGRQAEDEELDALLREAIEMGATDLHFDGSRASAEVCFRVHGEKHTIRTISFERARALMRVLYTRADSKSQEWVDDKFVQAAVTRTIAGHEYRLRYQHLPAIPGGVDLRLRVLPLASSGRNADFASIGFEPDQIRAVQDALDHPRGFVLLCGPMNSGKSTTLKASLEHLARRFQGRALIQTLEDPVEYQILGTRQTNVFGNIADPTIDNAAWAEATAALMRSDANIIMLGEIRNAATAKAAQHLNQTGHKLLATTHAITPFEGLSRVMDLGWDRDVMTASGAVAAVLRQALVPVLCKHCSHLMSEATAEQIDRELRTAVTMLLNDETGDVRLRGEGCEHCQFGYTDRTALLEILVPDERINERLGAGHRGEAEKMWRDRSAGVPKGLTTVTLLDHAMQKVKRGEVAPATIDMLVEPLRPMARKRGV